MSSSDPVRWGGLAAMLGGALWVIGNVIHASKPRGCVAEECAFRPMRESGALDGILMLLSLLLLLAGVVGLAVLALILGFVLLGIAILVAGVLPRWAALLLIVGALAMLGFNEQTALALMAVPLGVAWVAVGYVLWSGAGAQTGHPDARVR